MKFLRKILSIISRRNSQKQKFSKGTNIKNESLKCSNDLSVSWSVSKVESFSQFIKFLLVDFVLVILFDHLSVLLNLSFVGQTVHRMH
jgi:hypothetical protein